MPRTVLLMVMCNCNTLIKVWKLSYQNLGLMSCLSWVKFWNLTLFGVFEFFFQFQAGKFQILMVSSERKISFRSIKIDPFLILKYNMYAFLFKKILLDKKMIFFKLCCSFIFKLLPKCSDFMSSDDCIWKIFLLSIGKNPNVFETPIFGPKKMNVDVKTLDLC